MIDPLADMALFDLRVLAIEAGPLLALALALAAGLARLRRQRRAARERGRRPPPKPARRSLASEGGGGGARARRGGERSQIAVPGDDEPRNPHPARAAFSAWPTCLRDAGLDPEHASYVEAIRGSGAALANLIDQILDFSKIEAGRLELVREPFDLRQLVESIVELLAPQAQGKGLEIAASIAADAPRFVVGDCLRLRQALTNLAGNAVKFTERGGVGVSVERASDGRALVQGHGHRPRRSRRSPRRDLRGLRAGRRLACAPRRGRRARPRHFQAHRRLDGRRTHAGGQSRRRLDLFLRDSAAGLRRRAARGRAGHAQRPARADRRPFAVRSAGDRGSARRGGRRGRARRRARRRPRRAERGPEAGSRHHRLRARRGGDQSPGAGGARRRGAQEPGAVLAVRAARLRPDLAARFRRLAGQAGARSLAVRSPGERVRAPPPTRRPRRASARARARCGRCSPKTTTSTPSSRKRRCGGWGSRSCARATARRRRGSPARRRAAKRLGSTSS